MTSVNHRISPRAVGTLAAVLVASVLAGCSGEHKSFKMPPPPVGVEVVTPQTVPLIRDATGRLSAFRSADVRARVSGVLLARTYKEGSDVKKDQVLFKIDPAPLKASLDAAKASLAQTRATYVNARVNAQRGRKLAPQHYISKADLDNLEATERSAAAAMQAAKAKLDDAQINLGYATVRSPIAGRAGQQQVTEGALVGQGSATLLTTVQQINPVYVNFSIPVSELQQLRAEQANGKATLADGKQAAVQLSLADGSHYAHAGTLDFSAAAVDPATGSVTLRAIVPNPKDVLLPGMYASLKVNMGTLNQSYLIAQSAVLRDADSAYVLVVGDGNKVVRKNVVTQGQRGADWIVTSGIAPGDRLIVSGVAAAKVGEEVKPTVETAKAKPATPATQAPAKPAGKSAKPAKPASQA